VSAFLAELGTKLADRWLQALVLPGLLWTAVLAAGLDLGQRYPFDLARLSTGLDQLAARPAAHAPGTVILAAAGILLAGAAVGLAADVGGGLMQRLWVLPGDLPPASWLLSWRRHRWDKGTEALKAAIRDAARLPASRAPHGFGKQSTEAARAVARVRARQRHSNRLGPARPVCPTRIGDRFERAGARIGAVNCLPDLATVWPRLWSVLPDTLRTDITTARTAYSAAARLPAWGLLYTAIAALWWPAAPIGILVMAAAALQARTAASILADLIETATDLHLPDLATHLGIPIDTTPVDIGRAVTARLRATTAPPNTTGPAIPTPHIPATLTALHSPDTHK
jgi:hypothetical protein